MNKLIIKFKLNRTANARKWKHKIGGKFQSGGPFPLKRPAVLRFLYEIENPRRENIANGFATNYDSTTIGAGVDKKSGAPAWWFTGRRVPLEKVDSVAYLHFIHDDKVARNAYDTRFGTPGYPHPSDTLSIGPRLYMALNRYLMGFLGKNAEGRDEILDAVKSGNPRRIEATVMKHGRSGDYDRMRRLKKAWPQMYQKKKK